MSPSWVPCPMCFHPAEPEARFCSRCGASLDGGRTVSLPPPSSQATEVAAPDATLAYERATPAPPRATTTANADVVGYHVGGRYRIEGELGRGAFGVVMKGWDEKEQRPVAVKMLPGLGQVEPEERKGVLATFRREAQALAWLAHPAIVRLLDVVEDAEVPCLVMELVEGETLAAKLAREGALPIAEVLRILREVVEALHHAHSAGVVHRDLKPANLLLGAGGVVKVTDFGLAKVTTSVAATMGTKGGLMGTPHYMSPEQASGRSVDPRSDLFAVGAIAWEMLVGRKAFDGPLSTAIYRIIYEGVEKPSSARPGLPPVLDGVVMRALEKNVDVRYQNAREMAAALAEAAEALTVATPTDEMTVMSAPAPVVADTGEMPRPPGLLARATGSFAGDLERLFVVSGVALVIVAGIVALAMLSRPPDPARSRAAPPPGLHLSGEGVAYLDGVRIGELPLDVPLPSAGKHLVSVIVPQQGVLRRTVDVPQIPAFLEVKVPGEGLGRRGAAAPEELEILGVLVGEAAPVLPLALVRRPSGDKGWVHGGERLADGVTVAAVEPGSVAFELALSPPETGTWRLRRPLLPVTEPLGRAVNIGSDPRGLIVSIRGSDAALGYTPCQITLPDAEKVTLVFREGTKRELVMDDMDARRLAFMGELMVILPR